MNTPASADPVAEQILQLTNGRPIAVAPGLLTDNVARLSDALRPPSGPPLRAVVRMRPGFGFPDVVFRKRWSRRKIQSRATGATAKSLH